MPIGTIVTNRTERARSIENVTDRSGVELLVEVGTLLSATSVADLDAGLDLSVVAVAAYMGGRRAELVLRPVTAEAPSDPFPLAGAPGATPAPEPGLADAPGLTPGLPPVVTGAHEPAPPPEDPAAPAGITPPPSLSAGLPEPPTIGASPGLSDGQWQLLDEGRPVVDTTSLGGPAVLLPVSREGIVTAAVRVGGVANEEAVAASHTGGERGEVVHGVGALMGAALARREVAAAAEREPRKTRSISDLLPQLSHELRIPLNAILGFAQLLALAELGPVEADNVQQILRAGRHLLAVLDNALNAETAEAQLSLEDVQVEPIVAECLDLMRPVAQEAGVALSRPVTELGMLARADQQRLRQVLLNLLSNAIKYNRSGGRVTVDHHPADVHGNQVPAEVAERVRLTIDDTGRGIAADRLQEVFTPFERLGAERTGVEGAGLGLSVVKNLLDAMDAQISLNSIEGVGTTVHVDLPARAAAPDLLSSAIGGEVKDQATTTVLYVEDNPANVTLVQRVLSQRDQVHLVVAPDGAAGLRLVEELRPAVVLLDVHLPALNGDEVLAALREHVDPALRRTPVVIVTADVSGGAEDRLRTAGADAFIAKPVDVKLLLSEIDHFVR
jgi:signal transduction histidine kinase/CheY-like chemotaxis protein